MKKGWRIGFALLLVWVWLIFPAAVMGQQEKTPPPAAPAEEKAPPSTPPAKEKAAQSAEEKPAAPEGPAAATEEKPAEAKAPAEKKAPPPSEEGYPYIVKYGDTLWELSRHFLNNPFLWPKIWDKNKYIKNPNRIYPGDPLYIPGFEPKIVEAPPPPPPVPTPPTPTPAPPPLQKEEPPVVKPPVEAALPPELLVPEKLWRCSGYISETHPRFPGSIIGSSKRKTALSYADIVAINLGSRDGVKIGDRFDVLREIRRTSYPGNFFKTLGYLVKYVGILEAQEVAYDQARCVIIYSCEDVFLDDGVAPHKEIPIPFKKELVPAPPQWGLVVEDKQLMQAHGGRDVLFINLGANQGIKPGDIFEVYRPFDKSIFAKLVDSGQRTALEETTPGGKEVIYSIVLGRLLVIRTEPNTSVCLIQDGSTEFLVGYRVKWALKIKE